MRTGDYILKVWNMSGVIVKLVAGFFSSSGLKGQNMFTKECSRGSKPVRNTIMNRRTARQLLHQHLTFPEGALNCKTASSQNSSN